MNETYAASYLWIQYITFLVYFCNVDVTLVGVVNSVCRGMEVINLAEHVNVHRW